MLWAAAVLQAAVSVPAEAGDDAQSVANAAWAVAALLAPTARPFVERALARAPWADFEPAELSALVWAAAAARAAAVPLPVLQVADPLLPHFSPQSATNLLWAFWTLAVAQVTTTQQFYSLLKDCRLAREFELEFSTWQI